MWSDGDRGETTAGKRETDEDRWQRNPEEKLKTVRGKPDKVLKQFPSV